MKKIKCILFDLDGTLVNTGPDLLNSLNFTLKINKVSTLKIDELGNLVGGGAAEMIKKAYILNKKKLDLSKLPKLVDQFLDYYKKNTAKNSSLYPNVLITLKYLKENNFKLGVCTNKKQELAEKVLKELGIFKYFSVILGSSNKHKLKPDTEMLHYCMRKLNTEKNEVLMIGDSVNDILPSNKLSISSIFVNYGYGKTGHSSPTFKIDDIQEIIKLLGTY